MNVRIPHPRGSLTVHSDIPLGVFWRARASAPAKIDEWRWQNVGMESEA